VIGVKCSSTNNKEKVKERGKETEYKLLTIEEEFDAEPVASTKPKMAWDDEDVDDNDVKEDWDDSGSEEEVAPKKEEQPKQAAPPKKALTLKQKIAEKEAALKEQKKKKMALVIT
jgi:translation initiation factor 3 subunit J